MESVWSEQKLIRTAEMTVEVDSVTRAMKEVEAAAARHDGLVADTEVERDQEGSRRADIRVRVPSAKFEAAVADFRKMGEVKREKITTEDVTKAYVDLETRLSVKRKTEERLHAILSSRTGKLAEVLEAERELSRVTGEIEQLLGEQRYYDRRVAISTIEIAVYETGSALRPSVFAPVGEALAASLSVFSFSLGALIYVAVFLAPWLLVGVPVWWVVRNVRRRGNSAAGS